MADTEIRPQQITKPIQLLAAWLAGLAIVDVAFLTAAAAIAMPSWIPGLLTIAAVANVPLFLISLFLLQTRFRPEMQEDTYYSKYLENRYAGSAVKPKQIEDLEGHIKKLTDDIVAEVPRTTDEEKGKVSKILRDSELDILAKRFEHSRSLSELYMYPNLWHEIVAAWGDDRFFQEDIEELLGSGLVSMSGNDYGSMRLTSSGEDIAKLLESRKILWNQRNDRRIKRKEKGLGGSGLHSWQPKGEIAGI